MLKRLNYLRRIIAAYLFSGNSQLSFWHGVPQVNERARYDRLGEYYMPFRYKADYAGHFDAAGVPMLDYHGTVGLNYNPIAIAQYGLAHYNLYCLNGDESHRAKFLVQADWLVANLELNDKGVPVWKHKFDWEYRDLLRSGWYSALAQGQGISALVRAHELTGLDIYLDAANAALVSFQKDVDQGGVVFADDNGQPWLEETIVFPPTHILNGFLWALWGLYDLHLYRQDACAKELFDRCIVTLKDNLASYDTGFWSLYEHSGTRMKMLASFFYHSLHIVQLRVLHRMTHEPLFEHYADKWAAYAGRAWNRYRSLAYKAVFKLTHY